MRCRPSPEQGKLELFSLACYSRMLDEGATSSPKRNDPTKRKRKTGEGGGSGPEKLAPCAVRNGKRTAPRGGRDGLAGEGLEKRKLGVVRHRQAAVGNGKFEGL